MRTFQLFILSAIAIMYNLFVHSTASVMYRDYPYIEKHSNTILFIVIAGIIGIAISKLLLNDNKKYKNSVLSKGMFYGGVLLIATAIIANWEDATDEMKIGSVGCGLFFLIWLSYKTK